MAFDGVSIARRAALAVALLAPLSIAQESPRSDEPAVPRLDDRLLRTCHLDLLGRPPLLSERERWLGEERSRTVMAVLMH